MSLIKKKVKTLKRSLLKQNKKETISQTKVIYSDNTECMFDIKGEIVGVPMNRPTTSITNVMLAKEISLGDNVDKLNHYAFKNCKMLEKITLPNSIEHIGDYSFENCEKLEEIVIPNSVASIGTGSFYNCSSLKTVIIPKSVTKFSYRMFNKDFSLKEITYLGTYKDWCKIAKPDEWYGNIKLSIKCSDKTILIK